jgi:hypothetical protein
LQLDQQPEAYRGRLVTIGGVARSAKPVPAPANDYGIDQYFQLWVQSERTSPALVVLYCLELPEGFPLGIELDAPITATGFFYKRWAYASQSGITTAPLVLARTLTWQPLPPARERPAPSQPVGQQFVIAVIGALALAGAAIGFVVWRGRPAAKADGTVAADGRVAEALASLERAEGDSRRVGSTPGEPSES